MASHLCHYGCCLSSHLSKSYFCGIRPLVSSFAWTWSCNVWLLFSLLWNSCTLSLNLHLTSLLAFFIHVSFSWLSMLIILLIDLILSFNKEISALLMICRPLGVFTWLFSLILTGTTFSPRHLRVKHLWFWKSAIFNCSLSHWWKNVFAFFIIFSPNM